MEAMVKKNMGRVTDRAEYISEREGEFCPTLSRSEREITGHFT